MKMTKKGFVDDMIKLYFVDFKGPLCTVTATINVKINEMKSVYS